MNVALAKNHIEKIPDYWKQPLISIITITLISFVIFFESWSSLVEIWSRSKAYTHGFIIAPISVWLVWSKRHVYHDIYPKTSWFAVIAIIGFGVLWLAANLIHVLVVQQYAVVAMLISSFWLIIGTRVALQMIFPLAFLLLMVPVGESLIPPLMEYTATFTVAMIRFTGISVYREGMHFSLTSGNWSVVEACSGINYLIASITLGLVFAYITYNSLQKRLIFFVFSILIPIIANGFRAYLIVMIGHLSDMKLAVGDDHLLYGAVFFGMVIMLLFYIGSFWKDTEPETTEIKTPDKIDWGQPVKPRFMTLIPVVFLSLITWPVLSSMLSSQQSSSGLIVNFNGLKQHNWELIPDPEWGWLPGLKGVESESIHYFKNKQNIVGLYQANFGNESQKSGELVNSENVLIRPQDRKSNIWRIYSQGQSTLTSENNSFTADESILRSNYRDLVIKRWYLLGSKHTSSAYKAKFHQLYKRVTGNAAPELQIILFTQAGQHQHQHAETRLKNFAENWLNSSF